MDASSVLRCGPRVSISLPDSFAFCQRVTRRARSSFALSFRLLPPPKRAAMFALYAFLRTTDDLADEPGDAVAKRDALHDWRDRLDAALRGEYSHDLHPALHHVVREYRIPRHTLHDAIDGVLSDLDPVSFPTFDDLCLYCRRVASSVGLACVHVWGFDGDVGDPAEAAGIAFQLTNILRDLGEDLRAGRVYLPQEDLARFGCEPKGWSDPDHRDRFRAMMRFQVGRARLFYDRSRPLHRMLTPDGRAVFRAMTDTYRRLLDEIERRDYDVFSRRVRVGALSKLRIFAAAWPVKWGWSN